jgi:hypothetical protein
MLRLPGRRITVWKCYNGTPTGARSRLQTVVAVAEVVAVVVVVWVPTLRKDTGSKPSWRW